MTKEQVIERLKRKILLGKSEKNIGIPVYISELETVLSILEEKDKIIDLAAEELVHYKVINDPDFDNLKETFDKLVENEKQYFENEAKEVQ